MVYPLTQISEGFETDLIHKFISILYSNKFDLLDFRRQCLDAKYASDRSLIRLCRVVERWKVRKRVVLIIIFINYK